MKRIPKSREVDLALKDLSKKLTECMTEIHQRAAQVMSKGHFEKAEAIIGTAKQLQGFESHVDELKLQWRELKRGNNEPRRSSQTTPLWAYYLPILRVLMELGGEATRAEIESEVDSLMRPEFLPGDTDKMRHCLRWQLMTRRARKHLVNEGWLEPGRSKLWRITPQGKKAAKAERAQ